MSIVKSRFRISRMDGDFSSGTASSGKEDDESSASLDSAAGDVSDDGASDADSGMDSDEFDFSEIGEPGSELCQVGNQSFIFPLELYDLPDFGDVLSLETWNECLTEKERFALAEYLPDMDQENFALTLKELFSGSNFHFGNPLVFFFNQLKGGLCDPRVVLYRRCSTIFQRRQHYHKLCKYQNSMVGSLVQIRDAWQSCPGYGINERLRLLNVLRSQRSLGFHRNGDLDLEADSESSDSTGDYWSKRFNKGHVDLHLSKKATYNVPKEKAKGILKVAAPKVSAKKEYMRRPGFDSTDDRRRVADDNYFEDQEYRLAGRGDWDATHGTTRAKSVSLKSKRKELLKRYGRDIQSDFGEQDPDGFVGISNYLGRSKNSDQAVTIASYEYNARDSMKKLMLFDDRKYPPEEHLQHQVSKRSQVNRSDANRPYRHGKVCEEAISLDHAGTFDDTSIRAKKWKAKDDFGSQNNAGFYSKVSSCKAPPAKMGGSHFSSDYRTKAMQGELRIKSSRHEGVGMEYSAQSPITSQSEETQSDSSDQLEEGEGMNSYASKPVYPSPEVEARHGVVKLAHNVQKSSKLARSNKRVSHSPDGGISDHAAEMEPYSQKVEQKVKINESSYLYDGKSIRNGHMTLFNEKQKGSADLHHPWQQANGYFSHGRGTLYKTEENLEKNPRLTSKERRSNRSGNKSQISSDYALENDHLERSSMPILGCNSLSKKRKGKDGNGYLDEPNDPVHCQSNAKRQSEGSHAVKKAKRKGEVEAVTTSAAIPEPAIPEKVASELEMDMKAQKKSFTLITPTIHTDFSFSIIHLLSAVRKALITAQMEDTEDIDNHLRKDDVSMLGKRGEQKEFLQMANGVFQSHSHDHLEGSILKHRKSDLPSLTVQEIVNRVRSNPGDPCILETPELLQDLVRGVMKIFSSKSAPLGAKGWKVLVVYEKSNKSWSWVGPVPSSSSDNDNAEEETSAEAWGVPYKMLVKLVDAFANWLKSGQDTLQQIGSLPPPPAMLPVLDDKDRFRDLRAQKSLSTISPSSEEVRAYFHKEELLRYSIPDRAFQYTAVDGRKSIVAPLRRGGGKPTSKARDHFMLKPDRPPHVTILCLVRDAASRLPGSIGTRADVCTLIKDSQYIVEDVTDVQVNQVVSGALDRLHYERDPCVQFDGDRKLWVYLHRDREEEDFEDDGTSSTKKWKRQKKDVTEHSEMVGMNESIYKATGEEAAGGSSGCVFNPDHNIDSSAANLAEKGELVYNDLRPNRENVQSYVNPDNGDRGQSNPISWGLLGENSLQENKMICQENSTNKDFDDEAFNRGRPVGLLSASLF